LIGGKIRGERGEICPSHSLKDFSNFLEECQVASSSQEGKGKFALASGEEANNREKAREVYCPQDY